MIMFDLSIGENFFDAYSNVFRDLAQQNRRDISATMKRDSGASAVRMTVLFVRSPLSNFNET
jgi:hypothetical protein